MNMAVGQQDSARWTPFAQAAALFAVDPVGVAGIVLKARPGPVREHWLNQLQSLLPADAPWRKMPLHIGDDDLLGGLDLAATLRSGRPIPRRGLLAECHRGVLLLAMAERIEPGVAARLAAVLDTGIVVMERGGLSQRTPASLGMIALDEGIEEDESVPEALADRFAIHLDFYDIRVQEMGEPFASPEEIQNAKSLLPHIRIEDSLVEVLCRAALGFGIESLRVVSSAIRVARAAAALEGSESVSEANVALAAQLVFGSRVRQLPRSEEESEQEPDQDLEEQSAEQPEQEPQQEEPPPNPESEEPEQNQDSEDDREPQTLDDQVLEATVAAIPPQLLQQLQYPKIARGSARSSARSAAKRRPARRGRLVGTRPGDPSDGSRLNLVETLRAAVPWQRLRKAEDLARSGDNLPLVRVRREDFRVNRYQQRAATTTVFAVDASGSAAMHRLAEAKGAVELLLAESYQRRDQVALVTFRGRDAELLLSPTRSLVRAKRGLAALPGGGGTPLAAGIRLSLETALGIRRKGETPVLILLTDGSANVSLEGKGDRQQAASDALEAAQAVRIEGITALLVDTSPRPRPAARALAEAMAAHYLALPHADAQRLSGAAKTVLSDQRERATQP